MPVQAKVVPFILNRKDIVVRAKTGTGKTLSYLLPLVHKLLSKGAGVARKGPSAMVLVPTPELCQQVYDEAALLAEYWVGHCESYSQPPCRRPLRKWLCLGFLMCLWRRRPRLWLALARSNTSRGSSRVFCRCWCLTRRICGGF
jgi:hypothetical protein